MDKLSEARILELLNSITDEMAENSECEGEDDAEDVLPKARPSTSFSSSGNDFEDEGDAFVDAIPEESEHLLPREVNEEEENDSSSSEDDEIFTWSADGNNPRHFANFNFEEPFGIPKSVEVNESSPISVLLLVLTPNFLEHIVVQSNLYAIQCYNQLNLTVEELKAFFGILIIMGFHRLPSLRLYWSNDKNFYVSRIAEVMSLKRFLNILRFLHLNDNSKMEKRGEENFDRLYKIRPIIEHLNDIFKKLFHPSRYLSVDESMVKFKGRSSLKQYMQMKPIKRGFKIWVIACAVTGYCVGFSVYEGREKVGSSDIGLGERVVVKLTQAFEGLGYCIFFDNFFSGLLMVKRLISKKFFSCGTIRQTRKFYPKEVLKPDKSLKSGESDGVMSGDISVCKWKDRGTKCVSIISSMHNPQEKATVLRTQKDGTRKPISCPIAVKDYNKYMGGVDRFDQLHSEYSVSWKSRRWWMKLFYYCLDACIVNSFILYKTKVKATRNRKPLSQLQFRSTLGSQLIGSFSSRLKKGPIAQTGRGLKRNHPDSRPTVYNATRLTNVGEHLPEKGPTFRRCAHCSTTKHQKRSTTICVKCDVALCIECFIPFHRPASK